MKTQTAIANPRYEVSLLRLVAVAAALLGALLPFRLRAEPPPAKAASGAEQVLFAFDDHALPFQQGMRLKLLSSRSSGEQGASNVAVPVGPPGSADGRGVIYYGTVVEVNGELWMWYLGMGDQDEGRHYRICLAKRRRPLDGIAQ